MVGLAWSSWDKRLCSSCMLHRCRLRPEANICIMVPLLASSRRGGDNDMEECTQYMDSYKAHSPRGKNLEESPSRVSDSRTSRKMRCGLYCRRNCTCFSSGGHCLPFRRLRSEAGAIELRKELCLRPALWLTRWLSHHQTPVSRKTYFGGLKGDIDTLHTI